MAMCDLARVQVDAGLKEQVLQACRLVYSQALKQKPLQQSPGMWLKYIRFLQTQLHNSGS